MNTRKLFSMMLCATLSLSMIATAYADDLECSIDFGGTDVSTSENRTDSESFSDWVFEGEAEQTEENTQRSLRTAAETREKKIITSCEQSEIVDYGSCGDLVRWQLDKDGLLVISGEGEMKDYSYKFNPWKGNDTATKKIVVLEGVETIGDYAFYECKKLESVELSDSVRSIGKNAFSECSALEYIEFSDDLDYIGDYAFSGCKALSTVKIPDTFTAINEGVFRESGISDLQLPFGITEISKYAFSDCKGLSSIELPETVEVIGERAFAGTGLTEVDFPDSVNYIGINAFSGCKQLTKVQLPESVDLYSDDRDSQYYYHGAFSDCVSLCDVKLPNDMTVVRAGLFSGCRNLEYIELPDTVTKIESGAFKGTGIRSIVLPPNLETIIGKWSYGAFSDSALEKIYIPTSLKTIASDSFANCKYLKDVYYSGSLEEWKAISIGDYNDPLINAYIHYNYIPSDEHEWGEGVVTTPATCTSAGVMTYTCTKCNETKTESITKLEHSWNNGVVTKQPTASDTGVKTYTCTVCGATKTETIPATGGNTDSGNTSGGNTSGGNTDGGNTSGGNTTGGNTDGGNTSGGNTSGGNTSGGNTTGGNTDGGNTSGGNTNTECTHEYNEGVITKAPDCTNGGEKRYTCKKCGSSKVELLSALGHAYSEGHCIRCNALDVNFVPTISGPSLVFHGKTAKFTSTAAYSDFVKVLVDGIQISSNSYTLSQGSTIVTLTGNYTQSLSFGDHTITIVSSTGSPQMRFNVPNSPATSDNSAIGLYVIGISLSVIGIAVCAEILRRKIKTSN